MGVEVEVGDCMSFEDINYPPPSKLEQLLVGDPAFVASLITHGVSTDGASLITGVDDLSDVLIDYAWLKHSEVTALKAELMKYVERYGVMFDRIVTIDGTVT